MAKDSSLGLILIGGVIVVGALIYLKINGELVQLSQGNNAGAPTIVGLINKYQNLKASGAVQ
jgi:hypothetical protein